MNKILIDVLPATTTPAGVANLDVLPATTTPAGVANLIFAPGEYAVITMAGRTGTFSPTGSCDAQWIVSN